MLESKYQNLIILNIRGMKHIQKYILIWLSKIKKKFYLRLLAMIIGLTWEPIKAKINLIDPWWLEQLYPQDLIIFLVILLSKSARMLILFLTFKRHWLTLNPWSVYQNTQKFHPWTNILFTFQKNSLSLPYHRNKFQGK